MEQLADRIQWILENRLDPATKRPWEAKALSIAAHLGSDAHVGMMKRGTVKKPTAETLAAIAKAVKVSFWWLATGEGTPDSADPEPSTTDSSVPIARNVPGWNQVLQIDKLAAANSPSGKLLTEENWGRADLAARYLIHGPAVPGDALRIARLAAEVSDPHRYERALAANLKTLQAQLPDITAQAEQYRKDVEAMDRGEKPAAKKRPKKGGRG